MKSQRVELPHCALVAKAIIWPLSIAESTFVSPSAGIDTICW